MKRHEDTLTLRRPAGNHANQAACRRARQGVAGAGGKAALIGRNQPSWRRDALSARPKADRHSEEDLPNRVDFRGKTPFSCRPG